MEPNRLTAVESNSSDFLSWMDTIAILMKAVWGDEAPLFTMIKPDGTDSRNVEFPQIVYSLTSLQPGVVGNNQTREIKPRHRERKEEFSLLTGKPVVADYYGQVVDATIVFTIYANNNDEAYYWTQKLKHFLVEYKGYFLQEGVKNYWWKSERERNTEEGGKAYFSSRELHYHTQFEELTRVEQAMLENIELHVYVETRRSFLENNNMLPSQRVAHYKIKKNPSKQSD